MHSKGYIFAVLLITVITMGIGVALWYSGIQQLPIDKECKGWCRGAEEPLVIIDTYPDFGCSLCVNKERMIVQILDIYPDEVRMDYHHYPYNSFSYTLAEALECAGEQDMFWEMHDRLYLGEMPGNMSELLSAAESIGLNMSMFNASLNNGKFRDKVLDEKQQAIADGAGAASVYINKALYTGPSNSLEYFRSIIDAVIEEASADGGAR